MTNVTSQSPCAAVSGLMGEDPIGSAATHERYLFVEVPFPWSYPITASPHIPIPLRTFLENVANDGPKVRFQAFASDTAPSPKGFRRVIYFQKPEAKLFAQYEKKEFVVPESELSALAEALIQSPDRLQLDQSYMVQTESARDLFVCTHGRHDQCCGKRGYPIYRQLEERAAATDHLRVWRVSHLGGHRFAPTIADFPEGRFWAWIEPEDLDTLVHRHEPFAKIASKYRGWGGVGPMVQHLERDLLIDEGWKAVDFLKSGQVMQEDGDAVAVRIDYRSTDGTVSGTYEGSVIRTRSVTIGGCGKPLKEVQQFQLQHAVKG